MRIDAPEVDRVEEQHPRQCPGVAVYLVRAMTGVPLPADLKADLGPTSLNAVVPLSSPPTRSS